MRELNVNEIEQVNGALSDETCEAIGKATEVFFTVGGTLVGAAATVGLGGAIGGGIGGIVGTIVSSIVIKDCKK